MVELTHYHQDEETASMRNAEAANPNPNHNTTRSSATSTSDASTSASTSSQSHANQATTGAQAHTDSHAQRFRKELRRRILHTTPSWFAINMGTGIVSILLHNLPYQFDGLQRIADVIFALNIVLFILFLSLTVARYLIWPNLFLTMLFHPSQSLFLGTLPMGLATIINMIASSLAPAWGPKWSLVAWALWWFDAALSLVIAIGLPFVQFTRHSQSFDNITGIWFLPVVAPVVCAATGGVVAAQLQDPSHVRLTVVASYILWGTGVPLSVMLMTLYYARLAIYKIPPPTMIVSAFLPLGPCGQGAFGLLQLSSVVTSLASTTATTPFAAAGAGDDARIMALAVHAVTVPIALVIWGLGLVWLVLAVATIADMTAASIVPFNMGWWGYTFPMGVFASAAISFGHTLDSGAFRIIGTALALVVTILWLCLFLVTAYRAITGTMFFSPCLAEAGGEPPKYVSPARKYSYLPRPDA